MTPRFAVDLPLPPAAVSPNARVHWSARSRAVKGYRGECAWLILKAAKSARFPRPSTTAVVLHVEYRCARGAGGAVCHDEDNARACLKSAVDALVSAGVVETDSKKWVSWGRFNLITTKRAAAWKARGDGVTITIEAA